ncbi:hypothetical protein V6N11_053200 [Hibiscus sabdariffa]|uniref:Uncharacterized protein n=1 Tax=Hibiscus sabdariffa TaxID=183260 RepID=A0ABR2UCN2_9ROSI
MNEGFSEFTNGGSLYLRIWREATIAIGTVQLSLLSSVGTSESYCGGLSWNLSRRYLRASELARAGRYDY